MKCKRQDLIAGLDLLKHTVERKSTLAVLSECTIQTVGDKLELCATNLNTMIRVYLDAGGELPPMAFNHHMLSTVLKAAKKKRGEAVELTPGPLGSLGIGIANRKFSVEPGGDVRDRPKAIAGKGDEYFHSFHALSLDAALRYTALAVCKDESRLHLSRILLDGEGHLVSTDGHRMHIADDIAGFTDAGDNPMPTTISCHAAIIAAIKTTKASWVMGRLFGNGVLEMSLDGSDLNVLIYEKTDHHADGFPPWKNIVPNHQDTYAIGTAAMRDCLVTAVKVAKALNVDSRSGVAIHINGSATMSVPNAGFEETVQLAQAATKEITYGVNPDYMIDALKVEDLTAIVHYGDELDPILVEFDGFRGLVMPCRID